MVNDVVNECIKKNNINLIVRVITPWQAKGVEAAITYLGEQQEIRPLILLEEHEITGKCVTRSHFSDDATNHHFIEVNRWNLLSSSHWVTNTINRIKGVILNKPDKKKIDNCYVLCAGMIDFDWIKYIKGISGKHTTYILIDDGGGGYTGYEKGDPLCNPKSIKGRMYRLCVRMLQRRNAYVDFRLLKETKDGLRINDISSKYYSDTLKKQSKSEVSTEILERFSNSIVINTQPLFENGMLENNEDIETFETLEEELKKINRNVICKPHPRELNMTRYDIFKWDIFDEKTIPQEELFSKMKKKPTCVIGIFSSTLINVKVLLGIKAISLAKIFLQKELTSETRKCVEDYVSLFGGVIDMPTNSEELRAMLQDVET